MHKKSENLNCSLLFNLWHKNDYTFFQWIFHPEEMLLHSSAASSVVSASGAVIEVFCHGDDRPTGFCRYIAVGPLLLMPVSKSMSSAHNLMSKVAAMGFVIQ